LSIKASLLATTANVLKNLDKKDAVADDEWVTNEVLVTAAAAVARGKRLPAQDEAPQVEDEVEQEDEEEQDEDELTESEFDLPRVGGGGVGEQSRAVAQAKGILQEALRGGTEGINAVRTMMDSQPKELLANLGYSIALNGLEGSSCTVAHLDWHSSLSSSFVADRQFDVVIGSDVIYYKRDAPALAATIIAHTASDGVAYLMCQRGRRGLGDLVALLRTQGHVEEEEYTMIHLVNTNPENGGGGVNPLPVEEAGGKMVLITFRHMSAESNNTVQ
jgi:hypothetical protein